MADEVWKPVPAYRLLGVPAGYEASSDSQVRSVPRTLRHGRPAGGVVLKQQPDRDGYPTVKLGRKRIKVSVVVALAFHGRPEVRHLNGVRNDNKPENLAWGSRWDNEQDKKRYREEGLGQFIERQSLPKTPSRTGLISLSSAVSLEVVSCSLDTIRKAAQRDPLFPEVRDMDSLARLYDPSELRTWDQTRRRYQRRRP